MAVIIPDKYPDEGIDFALVLYIMKREKTDAAARK